MEIDMNNYKLVYKNIVWNCICVRPFINFNNKTNIEVEELEVLILDEKNKIKIFRDSVEEFQFLKI